MDLQSIKKWIERNHQVITLAATFGPFLVAALMVIYYTRGDLYMANTVLQEVGIVQIWSTGILSLVYLILQMVLVFIILNNYRNTQEKSWLKVVLTGFLGGIALVILPWFVFIAALLGVIVGWAILKFKKPTNTQSHAASRIIFICIAFTCLYTSLTSYPQVAATKVTLINNKTHVVSVLARKESYFFVENHKTHELQYIDVKDIKSIETCHDKYSPRNQTLASFITRRQDLALGCTP